MTARDRIIEAEPQWRDSFRSCMTRVAFHLQLTRAMLEFLCATSDEVRWDRRAFGGVFYPDNWMVTERALVKRGLIERVAPRPITHDGAPIPWKLTPVGSAVVEMLKTGGLYIEAEEAVRRFAARKGRK